MGGGNCLSGFATSSQAFFAMDALAQVIEEFGIKSMVDVACGDMCYMAAFLSFVDSVYNISYTGIDIVQEVVDSHVKKFSTSKAWKFICSDTRVVVPPRADLLYSRAMTQHLCTSDTLRV